MNPKKPKQEMDYSGFNKRTLFNYFLTPFIAHSIKNTGRDEARPNFFSKIPEDKTDTVPSEVKE